MTTEKRLPTKRAGIARQVVTNMELLDCMSPDEVQERLQEKRRIDSILQQVRLAL